MVTADQGHWRRAARIDELAHAWSLRHADRARASSDPEGESKSSETGVESAADDPAELLEQWRQALRVDDDTWFEHRLALDDLDADALGTLLTKVVEADRTGNWPELSFDDAWTEWAETFVRDTFPDERLPFAGDDPEAAEKASKEAPFTAFLLPILRVALGHFRQRSKVIAESTRRVQKDSLEVDGSGDPALESLPLRNQAFARMVDALGTRLFSIISPTLVLELNVARVKGHLEGDDGPSRFKSFSQKFLSQEEHRRAIYAEYSVMARLLAPAVRFWIESMSELVERYVADRQAIAETLFGGDDPGPILDLDLSISDPHRQGRSVAILHLEGGRKLVYKPKSLAIDIQFQNLLSWLGDRGLQHPHRILGVVAREGYGWCEHIEAHPCESPDGVERFYWRQGSFLALLYTLYGCDFHYENLIAEGETPVLIDLESLFHNESLFVGDDAFTLASRRLLESVYGIGLLPLVTRQSKSGPSVDLGGMSGRGGVQGFDAPVLVDQRLDTMRFEKKTVAMPDKQNRPTLQGEEVNPLDHLGVFLEGFRATYDLLASEKVEVEALLENFAEVPIRFIARPTMRYMSFIQQTRHPDYLRRGIDQERLLEHLWAEVGVREGLAPLVPSEKADIRVGDVPSFTSIPSSRHLWDSRDQRIENQFEESSLDRVRQRLRGLCEADREAQVTLINQALLPLDFSGPTIAKPVEVALPEAVDPPGADSYLEAAKVLGDRLAEQAILGERDVSWIGASTTTGEHWEWMLSPLGANLYDGVAGVGLFLGFLAEATGEARFEELARRSAKSLTDHLAHEDVPLSIGAFSGHAGVLYTLYQLSTLWEEPEILRSALDQSLPRLLDDAAEETGLDFMIGSAGGAVAALELHAHTGDSRLLDLARACADRLIATAEAQEHGVGWVSGAASRALAGFSHGCAGIVWSLHRLANHFDDPRLVELAEKGLAYERSLYDPQQRNWRDIRDLEDKADDDLHPLAWCHGGPGVALGRMLTRPFVEDEPSERMMEEILIAAEETLHHGFGGNQSLCHGDMGNAEVLLRLAAKFERDDWRHEAMRHTTRVAREVRSGIWKCGLPRHAETPGLMLGLAGIGYGLLRLANPDKVPSVLDLSTLP